MRATADVSHITLPGDYSEEIPSVEVRCRRCGYTVEVYGDGEDSIRRGFVMLREGCPRRERNYYIQGREIY